MHSNLTSQLLCVSSHLPAMNQLKSLSPPRAGLFSILLWLFFALSFIWFPYLGMITFPCHHHKRAKPSNETSISSSWSPYGHWSHGNMSNFTSTVPISVSNASLLDVFKDQKKRILSSCALREIPTTVYREATLRDLYHHILVDDKRKLLFCYIPKVGCSNWKRVFLILAGVVDPRQKQRPSIDVFRQVNSLSNYSPKEQEYRLLNYFKFAFIRHPAERVLSAYRNKIEHPLITDPEEQSIWDEVRYSILNSYRIKFNNKIAKEKEKLFPTFPEFIHFLYDSDVALMNEHYKPMVELCQPCAISYDYIGNFATLRQDADAILSYLNINSTLFWDRGKHVSVPTVSHVKKYYKSLSPIDFKRLEERFGDDFSFYNHLFPFEEDGGYSQLKKEVWKF